MKALVDAIDAKKTTIRLSPFSTFLGMKMVDPKEQFSYFVGELKKFKLSYLHVIESRVAGYMDVEASKRIDFLVDLWGKTSPIFIARGYNMDSAYRAMDEEYKDSDIAIVFERANLDLIFKVKNRLELTPYDKNKFYNNKEKDDYTTWSFSKEFKRAVAKIA